ncbi:MAG: class I SAM-dependent methyltransferase [Chromatiales bacterium]|nr:class I SAM-dependent methyltransferase [Chromatiales bacterium]
MKCRHCGSDIDSVALDLGSAPPSNSYLTAQHLFQAEWWYPLKILVCEQCWLVQTQDYVDAETLFSSNYAYFSSYSTSWLDHVRDYVAQMVARFALHGQSRVVEVAANDGYLLQYVQEQRIPCYGIEPTLSTANVAKEKGIDIVTRFFGMATAQELRGSHGPADLMVANNVLAHVPDINDFVRGFSALLKPDGVATFEFPHLLNMVEQKQFDTVYHEHFSYLSLTAVEAVFGSNGLAIFDVEPLPTHGGSLRVFAQRGDTGVRSCDPRVSELLCKERRAGIASLDFYRAFQRSAETIKNDFLRFLLDAKLAAKTVVAYGAAAKGNTLLNFAGVRSDLLAFVVDRNPDKQGKFMPGSRIPIVAEAQLNRVRPDYVVILPWNLKSEIGEQLQYTRQWNARLVTAVPQMEIW